MHRFHSAAFSVEQRGSQIPADAHQITVIFQGFWNDLLSLFIYFSLPPGPFKGRDLVPNRVAHHTVIGWPPVAARPHWPAANNHSPRVNSVPYFPMVYFALAVPGHYRCIWIRRKMFSAGDDVGTTVQFPFFMVPDASHTLHHDIVPWQDWAFNSQFGTSNYQVPFTTGNLGETAATFRFVWVHTPALWVA